MSHKITIGSVCFIKNHKNNSVLFLKRNREPMQGLYTGVGGKTNFDEDIHTSCVREVKEETGLTVSNLQLKGILKTILQNTNSSWILFIYTTDQYSGDLIECNEGKLNWVLASDINSLALIGFIKRILSHILNDTSFIEGTIIHDINGNILGEKLTFHSYEKQKQKNLQPKFTSKSNNIFFER